jgi:hypothetical protein
MTMPDRTDGEGPEIARGEEARNTDDVDTDRDGWLDLVGCHDRRRCASAARHFYRPVKCWGLVINEHHA